MAESRQQLPGPFLRGDATRLVAIGFAVGSVLVFLFGISLLILVREWLVRFGFGIYTYVVIGAPLTLATVFTVTAGTLAIAYGLLVHDTGAWYVATVVSALLATIGGVVAVSTGGGTWTIPAVGVLALLALWTDRSLFGLDDGRRG